MQDTGAAARDCRAFSRPSPQRGIRPLAVVRPIAVAAILCLAAGALAAPPAAAEPKRGGTLVVAAGGGLRHLNPAVQSGPQSGLGVQLFAGLVRLDDEFEPEPYLAERWEISEDGLSLHLPPRPGRPLPRRRAGDLGRRRLLARRRSRSTTPSAAPCSTRSTGWRRPTRTPS